MIDFASVPDKLFHLPSRTREILERMVKVMFCGVVAATLLGFSCRADAWGGKKGEVREMCHAIPSYHALAHATTAPVPSFFCLGVELFV